MDIITYMTLQAENGYSWEPEIGKSKNFQNWIAHLDLRTCKMCRNMHGKIWCMGEEPEVRPQLHKHCRCEIKACETIKAGTATVNKNNGADWYLKYESELPDYYLTAEQAKSVGWIPALANLSVICKNKMIYGGIFQNRNGHLPEKKGRTWYEADINYISGYRNKQRILFSNDGLIFVTFDHYSTFFEII